MFAYVHVTTRLDALNVQFAGKSTNLDVVPAALPSLRRSPLSDATIRGFVSVVPPVFVSLNSTHV